MVHPTSFMVHPTINVATAGVGNTPASVTEDLFAVVVSILAAALPIAVGLMLIGVVVVYYRWRGKRKMPAAS